MKIYENRLPLKNHFSLTVCLLQKTSLKCPLNAQDSSVLNKKLGDKVLHVISYKYQYLNPDNQYPDFR